MRTDTLIYPAQPPAQTAIKCLENAIVYVDFENISELIRRYGKDLIEIDFFTVVQNLIREKGLTIVDFIVYSNFEKQGSGRIQTLLRSMGLQTRHASNNGKNSSDLELTVDALRTLYKNPNIKVFVIVSSDRDIIPLLKAIRYEGKASFVLSTRNGFNQVVAGFADWHQYLEDLFGLTGPPVENLKPVDEAFNLLFAADITQEMIERAREVSRYFYGSHIWKRSLATGEPVNLLGYIKVISRVLNRFENELLHDFKAAHHLHYVTIYVDKENRLFLREGEKKGDIYTTKPDRGGG
ncbi:MAG: NYN domain-containing protein [Firmicutes bacterium]|nr:NYN domain-containing protein [Bacillota bacterium]